MCNGRGTCNSEGKCECTYPACGRICDTEWNGTRCNSCPIDGFYGPTCSQPCLCANGNCSMGKNGDGSCACDLGWAGPYCNITCPLGPGPSTCGGHGECLQADATCVCELGFAGKNCSLSCPDVNCTGHGICFDGTAGDGTRNCYSGYVGPACETPCDCEHGTCIPGNSTCICFGNWTGTRCEKCKPGTTGAFCNMTCFNGITNGTNCSCIDDWVKPQCDAKCPKDPSGNFTCGGPIQGTCNALTAACECIAPFKGPSCSCQPRLGPSRSLRPRLGPSCSLRPRLGPSRSSRPRLGPIS